MSDKPRVAANRIKTMIAAGEPCYVLTVRSHRTVDIIGVAAASGHQGVYIDLQHSTLTLDQCAQMCITALASNITPMVRVPNFDAGTIGRLLDNGAQGIIAPHVNSARDAKEIALSCKFPPHGERSVGSFGPHTIALDKLSLGELQPQLDAATMLVCMLETPEAIGASAEIAAVDGVDALMIGINDLSTALGVPGDYLDPRVKQAYATAIAACKKAGKPFLLANYREPSVLEPYVKLGASRCYFTGADIAFMIDGATRAQKKFADNDAKLKL